MVTNGDNDYSRSFFERIAAVTAADLITFDYYSRYHRSTGGTGRLGCTAASAGRPQQSAPPCSSAARCACCARCAHPRPAVQGCPARGSGSRRARPCASRTS